MRSNPPTRMSGQNQGGLPPQFGQHEAEAPVHRPDTPVLVPVTHAQKAPLSGLSLTSMILGIVSVVLILIFPGGAIITGVVGLVMGIIGMRRTKNRQDGPRGRGFAVAGVVTSAIAVVGSVAMILMVVVLLTSLPEAEPDSIVDIGGAAGILLL